MLTKARRCRKICVSLNHPNLAANALWEDRAQLRWEKVQAHHGRGGTCAEERSLSSALCG